MHAPLSGIRVLDLSRVLAGPFCSMILADLGAEVIKVESPWGDDSRQFGPFVDGTSAYYRLFNRSKMGITLDFKNDDDKEVLRDLVRRADVVVENFRPGVLEKLGLGPEELLEVNPRLVVTSISGFGQTGSLAKEPAYDLVAQAMSGLMSITGWQNGKPTRVGISLGDLIPGLYAAIGTVSALYQRESTGRGQHLDLAMYDSLISVMESVGMRALYDDVPPTRIGNDHGLSAPFSTYATKDGDVVIAITTNRLFERLANALDIPEMATDHRFAEPVARSENRVALRELIEEALSTKTRAETIALFEEHGVPTARVYDLDEALRSPFAEERGVIAEETDGFRTLASPLKLAGMEGPTPAPELGQHNDRIESWLSEDPR
ncbi:MULTISPECIES: CaiB/BaiF CoA transferase family protein [Corynebacterium]|uniref:CoA transferase n=1 Tax=Corynebacterium haemomassiliense TaxID=2754726 RepID=A0A7W2EBJ7_9CORY|nr:MULTISPECIES: CoA transferase [Corynebacterium]MBA5244676.1 CoA transferase [Corynebacterium haemomassiliense]MBF4547919.1 CoA transferase [Corynebacterium afermentans subsp. lipophilum]WJY59811.1 Formyl-coenzyme A transferase [Corynebacterium afermentans subsp. lipophilum]